MHGAVEHHRRGHAAGPQSADEGRGLPVAMRHRSPAALAAWRAAAAAGHLCRRPGLVDEHQAIRIQLRLEFKPGAPAPQDVRSEEHTSELQSLMRISYAVFC